MTKTRAKVLENVENEYARFRQDMLEKPKEQIFDEHGVINFYTVLYDFLEESELDGDAYKTLAEDGTHLLSGLWDRYLKWECASIGSDDDTAAFVTEYVDWRGSIAAM
jgi:hypothetical protein